MPYRLFAPPAFTTPIAIAQPNRATFERSEVGSFANGTPRTARYARVVWQFQRLTEAEYQTLIDNRPADGVLQFDTWEDTGNALVKCAGVMQPIRTGTQRDSERLGVQVVFTRVEVL